MITRETISEAIQKLGLKDTEVCIHSSMKSFGDKIECGISGLADVFLENGCTIVVPTFSYRFSQCPPKEMMLPRNGIGDYDEFRAEHEDIGIVFSPSCKEISVEYMGSFPQYILNHSNSVRGNHAMNSFTALGKEADKLVGAQTAENVYATFKQMYEDDGVVLLMGVSLDSATIIHYAEMLAGRNLFIRWAKNDKQELIPLAVGSCSEGFERLDPTLKQYEKRVVVGESVWRCYRVRDIVDACVAKIKEEPQITRCDDIHCQRCQDAIAGGPIIEKNVINQ